MFEDCTTAALRLTERLKAYHVATGKLHSHIWMLRSQPSSGS